MLVNNYPAARKVAAHLVRQGYREFVYIGPKELDNSEDIRFSGFRDGLARDGHSLRKEDVIRVGIQNANSGAQALAERLARRKKPVGIFCFHDLFGVMAVRTCARLKLDIPKEAGVAGFDNLPVASCLIPTLTTVGYHVGEMAEVAVRLLVDRMEGRAPKDVNYYLEPSLIVRASTSAEPAHQAAPDSLFRMAQDMLHDSVV